MKKSRILEGVLFGLLALITITAVFVALQRSKQYTPRVHKDSISPTTKLTQISPTVVQINKSSQVHFFLVAIDDNGKRGKRIGCNDSLVKVSKETTQSASLTNTFNELLSIKTSRYGQSGLYTALSLSSLKVNSAEIINGTANVKLTGRYFLGGVCDSPRFIEQLSETARQYPGVTDIKVTLNGIPIESLFSGRTESSPSPSATVE